MLFLIENHPRERKQGTISSSLLFLQKGIFLEMRYYTRSSLIVLFTESLRSSEYRAFRQKMTKIKKEIDLVESSFFAART
jgi:hypothetical protein